uniref:Uncharacterized protein n=1 Tax=Arundo donax TaxID=35708 RepID=A0A0A9AWA9_ARUDO
MVSIGPSDGGPSRIPRQAHPRGPTCAPMDGGDGGEDHQHLMLSEVC